MSAPDPTIAAIVLQACDISCCSGSPMCANGPGYDRFGIKPRTENEPHET